MVKILVPDYFGQQVLSGMRALARAGNICDIAWNFGFGKHFIKSKAIHRIFNVSMPKENELAYIEDIKSLVRTGDYDILLPFGLSSYAALSKHQQSILPHVAAMLPDFDTFKLANDKVSTNYYAANIGVSVPQIVQLSQHQKIEDIANEMRYPVVVKARGGSSSEGRLCFAKDKEELLKGYYHILEKKEAESTTAPMIQEFIPGLVHDACCLFANGEPLYVLTQKRQHAYPISGGPGALNITTHDKKLKETAIQLLSALNWHGPAQVEFKWDERDNTYKLIEINPKLWGTLDLSIKAGINFPGMIRDYLLNNIRSFNLTYEAGLTYRFNYSQYTLSLFEQWWRSGLRQAISDACIKTDFRDFERGDFWPDVLRMGVTVGRALKGGWRNTPFI